MVTDQSVHEGGLSSGLSRSPLYLDPITLRDGCGVLREDLLRHLDQHKVGTRLLFAGNLTRQPYMQGQHYRVSGELTVTDKVMNDTFWIGLWPGLGEDQLEYAASQIEYMLGRGSPR